MSRGEPDSLNASSPDCLDVIDRVAHDNLTIGSEARSLERGAEDVGIELGRLHVVDTNFRNDLIRYSEQLNLMVEFVLLRRRREHDF
jgi:hypothetical protein